MAWLGPLWPNREAGFGSQHVTSSRHPTLRPGLKSGSRNRPPSSSPLCLDLHSPLCFVLFFTALRCLPIAGSSLLVGVRQTLFLRRTSAEHVLPRALAK